MDEFDFAIWLDDELRKRDMSNLQFARRAGISPSAVSRYLEFDRSPTLKTLLTILDALHMHMEIVHDY